MSRRSRGRKKKRQSKKKGRCNENTPAIAKWCLAEY